MAAAWLILNVADLFLTSRALSAGAVEANPLWNFLLSYNFWAFVVGKMAIALGVVGIYEAFKNHKKIVYVFSLGNLLIGLIVVYELAILS